MNPASCMCHSKDRKTDDFGSVCLLVDSKKPNHRLHRFFMRFSIWVLFLLAGAALVCAQPTGRTSTRSLREVNKVAQPPATSVIAIVGARLIDGRGGPVVADSVVVIRGDRIVVVDKQGEVKIPPGAEV